MGAKKSTTKRAKAAKEVDAANGIELIATALSRHESAIRQLAEVVVNLHANVAALRDVVDALAAESETPRIARARARLRAVKLRE